MSVDNRVLVAFVALALAGVAVGATGGPVADRALQVNQTPQVQFDDQTSNGSVVTVANATLPDGGYVAVYNESGALLGASDYLDNGSVADVEVSLVRELADDGTVVAIAHRDTDANRQFTYLVTNGDQDGPYVANRIVMDVSEVTVEAPAEATETPVANVTPTPGEETPTPAEETPGEETPAPGEETPGEETPAPGEETPAPGEETPGEETPAEETPGEETPGEGTPTPTPGA